VPVSLISWNSLTKKNTWVAFCVMFVAHESAVDESQEQGVVLLQPNEVRL